MALFGSQNITISDITKRLTGKDGRRIEQIAEVAKEINPVMEDMTFIECNDGTGHKGTIRLGYPKGTWRRHYGGVQSTKSSTQQIRSACGNLECRPHIDADVIDDSKGKKSEIRWSENLAHVIGMTEQVAETVFYGNTDFTPERFNGFASYYNAYTRATPDRTKIDYNVFDGGGVGSANGSIYFINWGPHTCTGLYPGGSTAGLKHTDMMKQSVSAADGSGRLDVYEDKYQWKIGLFVKNWQASGRICNIDIDALESGSGAADLVRLMIRLQSRLRDKKLGHTVIYMPERILTSLRLQMLGNDPSEFNANVRLSFDTVAGHPVVMFGSDPVKMCDSLLLTEATVPQAT